MSNPKKHLFDNDPDALDAFVYERVTTFPEGGLRYRKSETAVLFQWLGIDYRFRSDVFKSLKRLRDKGCVSRVEVPAEPQGRGEPKRKGSRDVIYVALKSPTQVADERKARPVRYGRRLVTV